MLHMTVNVLSYIKKHGDTPGQEITEDIRGNWVLLCGPYKDGSAINSDHYTKHKKITWFDSLRVTCPECIKKIKEIGL